MPTIPATYTEADVAVQGIINQLRIMHGRGVDLAEAYKAIDVLREEEDRRARMSKTLQGVAELALQGVQPRLFVVSYRRGKSGGIRVAHGVIFDKAVYVEPGHGVLSGTIPTLLALQGILAGAEIEYHLKYVEPPKKAEHAQ